MQATSCPLRVCTRGKTLRSGSCRSPHAPHCGRWSPGWPRDPLGALPAAVAQDSRPPLSVPTRPSPDLSPVLVSEAQVPAPTEPGPSPLTVCAASIRSAAVFSSQARLSQQISQGWGASQGAGASPLSQLPPGGTGPILICFLLFFLFSYLVCGDFLAL